MTVSKRKNLGCIFDLDGVIVDTARYHFLAWRRLANSLGFDFTEADNEKLKGVSRVESLNLILTWGGLTKTEIEKAALMDKKNRWYLEYIDLMTEEEILDGVLPFFYELQDLRIPIALGSASKNAERILHRIGMQHFFDVIIDGNKCTRSKPDPEVFLMAAAGLKLSPEQCMVFEDADKGIEAANRGGFITVGVGHDEQLKDARLVIPGFKQLTFSELCRRLGLTIPAIEF